MAYDLLLEHDYRAARWATTVWNGLHASERDILVRLQVLLLGKGPASFRCTQAACGGLSSLCFPETRDVVTGPVQQNTGCAGVEVTEGVLLWEKRLGIYSSSSFPFTIAQRVATWWFIHRKKTREKEEVAKPEVNAGHSCRILGLVFAWWRVWVRAQVSSVVLRAVAATYSLESCSFRILGVNPCSLCKLI